jgi:hypothetical protein
MKPNTATAARRPLTLATLAAPYRWAPKPGHRQFSNPSKADLDERKALAK